MSLSIPSTLKTPGLKMPSAPKLGETTKMPSLFKGGGDHIVSSNINLLKNAGYSHAQAVRTALSHRAKFGKSVRMIPLRKNPMKLLRLSQPKLDPVEV